tara:strand:- start:124 stop:1506 length:1383 start_codon:yes stop_codon:yes gene_type:complete
MSVTRTFTVTVVSTGSGNKYFIDGVQQATINIAENGTYKFDQSDNSNSTHPLRFSTTSDGTHGGGYEYTTGVTTYGTPGQAGAYTQITVAESAPTLYYYCTNHSGMGGQANTVDDNTWGMWAWSTNEWGDQGPIDFTPTGVSATSSVGSVTSSQIITVPLTGLSTTSTVGTPTTLPTEFINITGVSATSSIGSPTLDIFTVSLTGLSTTSSVGSPNTGQLSVVDLTGVSATTELGSFDNAGTLVGWGRNGWGEEPYGDSFNKLEQLAGVSATGSVGSLGFDIISGASLTGVSATTSVGSLSFVIDSTPVITGVSATASVGIVDPDQDIVGLSGLGMTSNVGSISPADVEGLTGVSTTSSVGDVEILQTEIVTPTGVSSTSSVGSLTLEIGVPLTGVSSTASTGSITPTDVMGLTGVQATASVNADGLILKYFGKLTPKTSSGYTTKTPKVSSGYTTKTPA